MLIMDINSKKTDIHMTKVYDQNLEVANLKDIINNIKQINSRNANYSHARD